MQPALSSERWFVVRDEAFGWFECSFVKIALREDVTNSCTGNLLFLTALSGLKFVGVRKIFCSFYVFYFCVDKLKI